ncbi:MAG TPA: mycofactocin precursor MftA [Ilumatobacteraceae bacterium]|nr:mycofactocin precursor MftA [Ilumatobacteraceae bacterium]
MDDIATETATANGTEVPDELLDDELLVEEISIDGMCGVY